MTTATPDPAPTFGLPACDAVLIRKLRNMPPEQLAHILVPTSTTTLQLPKERP